MRFVVAALVLVAFGAGLLLDTGAVLRLAGNLASAFPARLIGFAAVTGLGLLTIKRTGFSRRLAFGHWQRGAANRRPSGRVRGQMRNKTGKARRATGPAAPRPRHRRRNAS